MVWNNATRGHRLFRVNVGLSEAVLSQIDHMDEMDRRGRIVAVQCFLGVCSNSLDTALWAHTASPLPKAFPASAAAIDGYRKKWPRRR
jgi:hypothetical protein